MSLCSHVCHPGWLSIYLMQFVQQGRGTSVNPTEWRPAGLGHVAARPRAPAESHWRCCTTPPRYEGINTCLHSTAGLMRNCSKPRSKSLVTNSLAGSAETILPVVFSEPPTSSAPTSPVLQGGQIWLHMCARTVCGCMNLCAFACVWQCVS